MKITSRSTSREQQNDQVKTPLLDNSKSPAPTNKFLDTLINVVLSLTCIIALSASIFIVVNVFQFAYEAYKLGQSPENEEELLKKVMIVVYKFGMLLMFTVALIMGTLIPLALMYVLLIPVKTKKRRD